MTENQTITNIQPTTMVLLICKEKGLRPTMAEDAPFSKCTTQGSLKQNQRATTTFFDRFSLSLPHPDIRTA
jgi:hypothetical protein